MVIASAAAHACATRSRSQPTSAAVGGMAQLVGANGGAQRHPPQHAPGAARIDADAARPLLGLPSTSTPHHADRDQRPAVSLLGAPPEEGHLPTHGSDFGLFQLADVLGMKQAIFVKDEDGLYDKDPKKHKDAKKFGKITLAELMTQFPRTTSSTRSYSTPGGRQEPQAHRDRQRPRAGAAHARAPWRGCRHVIVKEEARG